MINLKLEDFSLQPVTDDRGDGVVVEQRRFQPVTAHSATVLAVVMMEQMRFANNRGDLYREYSNERLFRMLEQNMEEVKLAFRHGNDITDKLGDALNYLAFILHNVLHPNPAVIVDDMEVLRWLSQCAQKVYAEPMSEAVYKEFEEAILELPEHLRIAEAQ